MTINFTIEGNQDDKVKGNPIPYTRTTQKSKWSDKYQRYQEWKGYVVKALLQSRPPFMGEMTRRIALKGKPLGKQFRGKIETTIFFGNETHCDPDNVVKGIADALFENDKHVDVATSHSCGASEPKVMVTLTLDELE